MAVFEIKFHKGGVYLPALGLWLDPHEPKMGPERVFVSHAHSDHTGLHREIILSAPTSRLMHARMGGEWLEHSLPFGEKRDFEFNSQKYSITLLPAGHIFGSAMSLIEADGQSLLYTGDFKLRKGMSAEPCQPCHADILIMETTYGKKTYRFPPTPDVIQGIIRFCKEALDNEETPVLLGYSLGKSQEMLCGLQAAGLPIVLHGTVHKLTKIYEDFGQCFPAYEKYENGSAKGKVLICPPNVAGSAMLRSLGRPRLAVITGWAVDPNCRFRYQAHAAFPLSDHADFPDLVEFVQQVQPKKVLTLHGFAADFAQTLRDMGFDAQALSQEEQLALALAVESGPRRRPEVVEEPVAAGSPVTGDQASLFEKFASVCAEVGKTTKKLEKTRILSEYLKTLDSATLGLVTPWFTGMPFPSSQNKVLQLGWAVIRDALCSVGQLDQSEFGQVYLKHSDLGETVAEVVGSRAPVAAHLSVPDVDQVFHGLLNARGPLAKLPILVRALQQATPLEGKFLVKILTGDLRIGLKEGLVEEAIAQAFEMPLDEIKNSNLLLGNIGETAQLAARGQLASVTLIPFRPTKYMLASPEETAADLWNRVLEWHAPSKKKNTTELNLPRISPQSFKNPVVWIEDKYDGIRCQLHKVGKSVALYSRDLKEVTNTFTELADLVRKVEHDFILDGEIVAMKGEQVLPFADLQRRLGRREGDLFLGEQMPVQYVAFDLLWLNGESFLEKPLSERREKLEQLPGYNLKLARTTKADSSEAIEAAFTAARERGNEGLMIKDPASVYTPGRRGLAWLKLKKALATLDCVVVGAEYGHGKRKGVLSDYTFAVKDETSGELKTIGKAYSGLTDLEIATLTQHFLKRTLWTSGRYHEVEPDTVLEIAFDLIQPSARHTSGLAMRFPRIVRIREDKTPAEIDTVETARKLIKRSA